MKRTMILVVGLSVSLSLVGCGGSDDSTDDKGLDSGLDPNKKGEDLTSEEIDQFCMAIGDYVEEVGVQEGVCDALAFAAGVAALAAAGDSEAACEGARDECLEDNDLAPECDGEPPEDCGNSVGEVEDCFQAFIDAQAARLKKYDLPPCDGIEDWLKDHVEELEDLSDEEDIAIEDIPECKALDDACID